MTSKHHFYQAIRGRIIHVTSIQGLAGILADGVIRHDADGHLESSEDGDACERCGGCSVLDFANAEEAKLFDRGWQNWTGVFHTHQPDIALILDPSTTLPKLRHLTLEEVCAFGGRYISEAEACHIGDIELASVSEAWIVGAKFRIVFRSHSLKKVLRRAQRSEKLLRKRKSPMWGWRTPCSLIEAAPLKECRSDLTPKESTSLSTS